MVAWSEAVRPYTFIPFFSQSLASTAISLRPSLLLLLASHITTHSLYIGVSSTEAVMSTLSSFHILKSLIFGSSPLRITLFSCLTNSWVAIHTLSFQGRVAMV